MANKGFWHSQPLTHVTGGTHNFGNGGLPLRGPNGGRTVVDRILICALLTDVTVAGTAIQGEDRWRSIKRVTAETKGGLIRRDLTGDGLRQWHYLSIGPRHTPEYADSAVAANQDLTVHLPLPFTLPNAFRPKDFAWAADAIENVSLEGSENGTSGLGVSTGTITVNTGSTNKYKLIFEVHEEENLEFKAEDVIREHSFLSTANTKMTVNGKLQDLVLFARGASGGASMANFTDIRIDGIMPKSTTKTELTRMWQYTRGNVANLSSTQGSAVRLDPFTLATPNGVPVFWTDENTRVFDGPMVGDVDIETTNTVASLIAVHRCVKPQQVSTIDAVASQHDVDPADARIKTAGKTQRDVGAWDAIRAAFMPKSVPLPPRRT